MSYLKHGQGKHAPLCSLKPASSIPNIYQKYQHWNKTVNRIAVRGDPFKHFPCTYQESNQRSTIHRKEFTHVDIFFRDRHLFQFELFYHFFFNFNHWVDGYKLQYYVEISWCQDFICSFYVFVFQSINRCCNWLWVSATTNYWNDARVQHWLSYFFSIFLFF